MLSGTPRAAMNSDGSQPSSTLPTPRASPFRESLAAEMSASAAAQDSDDEFGHEYPADGGGEFSLDGNDEVVQLTQDTSLADLDFSDENARTLQTPLFVKTGSAGGVRILQLGRYTNTLSQYPNNYRCIVRFHDYLDQASLIWYSACILPSGKYELRPLDRPDGRVFVASTATTMFKAAVASGQRLGGGTFSLSGPRKMGLNHPLVLSLFKDMWEIDQPGKRNHGGRRGDTTSITLPRVRIGEVPVVNTYEARLRPSRSTRAPAAAPEDLFSRPPPQQPSWGGAGDSDSDSDTDNRLADPAGYQNTVPRAHSRVLPSAADRDAVEALTGLMFSRPAAEESSEGSEAGSRKRRRAGSDGSAAASPYSPALPAGTNAAAHERLLAEHRAAVARLEGAFALSAARLAALRASEREKGGFLGLLSLTGDGEVRTRVEDQIDAVRKEAEALEAGMERVLGMVRAAAEAAEGTERTQLLPAHANGHAEAAGTVKGEDDRAASEERHSGAIGEQ
ncbi:hypothetical protein DFJ74DRAFT_768305 [Hyaloraphidium curvatum]|nr:hypothetical protein DFJ74DRAFT_768305 [Hyaloraphidium curvatum]